MAWKAMLTRPRISIVVGLPTSTSTTKSHFVYQMLFMNWNFILKNSAESLRLPFGWWECQLLNKTFGIMILQREIFSPKCWSFSHEISASVLR